MAAQGDRIVTRVKARMREASKLVTVAERELRAALREIKRHPACRLPRGLHREERLPLAYWLRECLQGLLEDAFEDTARWLREDSQNPERSLQAYMDEYRRNVALFARGRRGGRRRSKARGGKA
jgi:hypothetical protein